MSKKCCKCKKEKLVECFGKLSCSKDGLRYDCVDCRKEYRVRKSVHIKEKQKSFYEANKEELAVKNKEYRDLHKTEIYEQRKEYRNREDIKTYIKKKQQEYLPIRKIKIKERRKIDINFKMSEILRSKIHKMLHNRKSSYIKYLGCDIEWFKEWIEFRFHDDMNWDNLGSYWQIDHILPINSFDFTNENDITICFHWTNLQPLQAYENRQITTTLLL